MTYNHARFIEHAVESVLAQKLDGGHEILIADDCSTDGTSEIIRAYGERHPESIRLLLPELNLGESAVRALGARAARGSYVALLDGDDYWTSPDKLRKQVEFLDRRPDYAMCFHNAMVVYDDGSSEPHPFHSTNPAHRLSSAVPSETSTVEDLAVGNFILASSVMFRNGLINQFPHWYYQARLPDWPFHVLNAEHGRIGYIDEVLNAYRVHSGGAWSDRISHLREPQDLLDIIWLHDAINQHLEFRYDARIKERTANLSALAARLLANEGRLEEAGVHARRSLADAPNLNGVRNRVQLEVLARPSLARPLVAAVKRRRARRSSGSDA
jgi:glycosyltransferase involved in cell wall biosynthesis